MSTIKEKNQDIMKSAMKSGDKATVQFSRTLHAAIRKKEIDDRKDVTDEEVMKLIATALKQREDSIAQFKAGGREDLVQAEEAEANYLRQFMPAQMSDDELMTLVKSVMTEVDAKDPKDLGKVMKVIQPKVQGRADGKRVNEAVRKALQG